MIREKPAFAFAAGILLLVTLPASAEDRPALPTLLAQPAPAGKAPARAPGVGAMTSEQFSNVVQTPEQRIARHEAELARLSARLATLELRIGQHTHNVPITRVGLLSEPINGRRVELAIDPRSENARSSPPLP